MSFTIKRRYHKFNANLIAYTPMRQDGIKKPNDYELQKGMQPPNQNSPIDAGELPFQ
jgi:hypothetical protein